jgi:glyoxylase-like metal-dependent hydrolase (beta-lactamase superfamily II)
VSFLFIRASSEQIDLAFKKHSLIWREEWSTWVSPYNCLLVDTGEHRVLIDTGADGYGPDTGKLPHNLLSNGVSLDSIDRVVLTHAHPDHIGGCTDDLGRSVYSRAHYTMLKDEWDFWRSGRAEKEINEIDRESLLQIEFKNLPAIRNQLQLIEGEQDIVPGVRTIPAPGHTPGHMAVLITSGEHKLLYLSDALFHPLQVGHPEWSGLADLDSGQTIASRRYLLNKLPLKKPWCLVFISRFRSGMDYQYRPVTGLETS